MSAAPSFSEPLVKTGQQNVPNLFSNRPVFHQVSHAALVLRHVSAWVVIMVVTIVSHL